MQSRFTLFFEGMLVLGLLFAGCGKSGSSSNDDADASSDIGSDTESETTSSDLDSDSDGDGDTDSATEVDTDSDSEVDTDSDTEVSTDSDTEVSTDGCGNGVIEPGEVCDDGNGLPGDGCSAGCDAIEEGFACLAPDESCVSSVVCGDGLVRGTETCDDFNDESGDGCSSSCQMEEGFICSEPGKRCFARECGDSIMAGSEQCDDGNDISSDGCSAECELEDGWACSDPGEPCHTAICNDGVHEGSEPCDDGNLVIGDGCTPFCEIEPNCDDGECTSACGDGMMLPGDDEECDDGNAMDGDGCSALCVIESGYECIDIVDELPDTLEVPITFRDFIARPLSTGIRHPDFENYSGSDPTPGMVESVLGSDGKPVYTGICETGNIIGPCPYNEQTTSEADFNQWYNDVPGFNITEVTKLALDRQADGSYYFPDATFFPWDDLGWVAQGLEETSDEHNFGFTSELRYWFEFKGDEYLHFSGDDDVWVFINHQLVVDIGGLHPERNGEVTLDETVATSIGLELGKVYEIVLFHAERHTNASNFNLTVSGFVETYSECESICGDGIVVGNEICDDGINDGSYGSCMSDCTPGPRCGDGILQDPPEICDEGINLQTYSYTGIPGCAPGCILGGYCGDSRIDSLFGEQCDDGANSGGYGECAEGCILGERCGDSVIQASEGEECDDGNTVSGDGCSSTCQNDIEVV
ncbi:MAG: DUF4215 domain-containing protein [Proteobacteria bacterium]|nr:DUF4215 domain-containing protein [Pseudomonadota bacterium]